MKHIPNSSEKPALALQDTAEIITVITTMAILGEHPSIKRVGEHAKQLLDDVLSERTQPELEAFIGEEASIILAGLKVRTWQSDKGTRSEWPAAQADGMLEEYAQTLPAAQFEAAPETSARILSMVQA